MRTLGGRVIGGHTRLGKVLTPWRANLATDLGGMDALSTQQRTPVDDTVKLNLVFDNMDAWVPAQPWLVNKAKWALLPVVREHLSMVGHLQSLLRNLGLERKVCKLLTPDSCLATKRATDPAGNVAGHTLATSPATQETRE